MEVPVKEEVSARFECIHGLKIFAAKQCKYFSCVFFNRLFSGEEIRAKLSTNLLKTLHKPRKDLSLVRILGDISPRITFAVRNARSRCPKK